MNLFEVLICSGFCLIVCQCADVDSPEVILIKDEDDVVGSAPDIGESASPVLFAVLFCRQDNDKYVTNKRWCPFFFF